MNAKISKTPEQWAKELSPEQFHVMREAGTEPPFSGEYYQHKAQGLYRCAGCGTPLFNSNAKFDSGTGWPSFWEALPEATATTIDNRHGMRRVEVHCATCEAHLGHIFEDGPPPTGARFCINSLCLDFQEADSK